MPGDFTGSSLYILCLRITWVQVNLKHRMYTSKTQVRMYNLKRRMYTYVGCRLGVQLS